MADRCPLCLQLLADAGGEYHTQDPKLILECRDTQIANLKAQLDRAHLLLVKSRDALDLAIGALQQREHGAAIDDLGEKKDG